MPIPRLRNGLVWEYPTAPWPRVKSRSLSRGIRRLSMRDWLGRRCHLPIWVYQAPIYEPKRLDKAEKFYSLYREKYRIGAPALELGGGSGGAGAGTGSGTGIREDIKSHQGRILYTGWEFFLKRTTLKPASGNSELLGYQARMNEFDENGQHFYRVLIGPYVDEQSSTARQSRTRKDSKRAVYNFRGIVLYEISRKADPPPQTILLDKTAASGDGFFFSAWEIFTRCLAMTPCRRRLFSVSR